MKQLQLVLLNRSMAGVIVFAIGVLFPEIAPAQQSADTKTVTVVHKLSYSTVDAIKDAATAAGVVAVAGQPLRIPLSVVKGMAMNRAFQWMGKTLAKAQVCRTFQMWANSCGQTEAQTTITIEIILDGGGEPKPRIVIPFVAKKLGNKGNVSYGYCAPMDAAGNPVMKLDVFGDGSVIIDAVRCNMDR